jgi:hypothetical protein
MERLKYDNYLQYNSSFLRDHLHIASNYFVFVTNKNNIFGNGFELL